jgi:hypothetical protein
MAEKRIVAFTLALVAALVCCACDNGVSLDRLDDKIKVAAKACRYGGAETVYAQVAPNNQVALYCYWPVK